MLQIRNTVFTPEEQIDIITALRKSDIPTDLLMKVARDISRLRDVPDTEKLTPKYRSTPWRPENPASDMILDNPVSEEPVRQNLGRCQDPHINT